MILTAKDVTISYDNKIAVDAVNFSLCSGDYLCIVGENGSGKSTLIKGMLGLIKLKSGEFIWGDGVIPTEIGYLPQQTNVQRDFPASVYEVVLSGCLNQRGLKPFYSKKEKDIANNAITKLDIDEIKCKSYRELSGGQQQRVLLARAVCATRKILILDEPVSGLDPLITAELYALVKKLNKDDGITVIMVSHDIKASTLNANKIMHMGTSISFYGTTDDYINSKTSDGFMGGIYG